MKLKDLSMIKILLSLILVALLFTSCTEDNTTDPPDQAPAIPPENTFVMDFAAFPDTNANGAFQKIGGVDSSEYDNWGYSYGTAVVWKFLLDVTLAIPKLSFGEAFKHQARQQENGSWLWEYNVGNHNAKLFGTTTAQGIEWRMLLTKNGFYENFEWYTGVSNLPVTQGSWTLNKDPFDPVPFLQIDWNRNPAESTADIKYTNIIPDDPENGGYIFYGVTNSTPYNAFYDIYNKGQENHTNVEWNLEAYNGRVMDPLHFADSDWHCWDENLMNIDCP